MGKEKRKWARRKRKKAIDKREKWIMDKFYGIGVCVLGATDIWLVMELADGGSLYSLLSSEAALSWDERWVKKRQKISKIKTLKKKKEN